MLFAVLLSVVAVAGQEPPRDCARPSGHLETVACYGERREQVEADQRAVLSRINQWLDRLPAEGGVNPQQAKQSLDQAQTHWAAFVAADCRAGEALFGEGNAFALDSLDCEITHYQDRNRQLAAFEARYGGA
ncbi:lysozyme inhibitor LprI family protein [Brevundimonas sp. GCM10030266]|uniref:lysozyme inhibitor LprI family protein n=1 Tax=Brevundimonas sp. GCM10030266 TaxID=3273386 RepID=UPI00361C1C03